MRSEEIRQIPQVMNENMQRATTMAEIEAVGRATIAVLLAEVAAQLAEYNERERAKL